MVVFSNLLYEASDSVEIRVGNVSVINHTGNAQVLLSQNRLVWSQKYGKFFKPFFSRQLQFLVEPPVVGRWVAVHKVVDVSREIDPTMVVEEVQVFGVPSVPAAPPKRFQLRLVGGTAANSGRLEMYSGSQWGTICDRTFDDVAATVACKELGYKSGLAIAGWGAGTGPVLQTDIRCNASIHKWLSQCDSGGNISAHLCWHRKDVGVICKDTPPTSQESSAFVPVSIFAGASHTCATSADGKMKCFGQNREGQLGLGDYLERGGRPEHMGPLLPSVKLGPRLTVAAVAGGLAHTCAVLQPGGVVKCWGRNLEGQLGLPGNTQALGDGLGEMGSDLPAVDLGPGLTATHITAGMYHTCVLLQPGGIIKCWGYNGNGQLGLGDMEWRGDQAGEMGAALPAVDLGPGLTATDIAAGSNHNCALLQPGGIVKCWGYNNYGQLGLGDVIDRGGVPGHMGAALPAVDLGRGFEATGVACGGRFSCAVSKPLGIVKCWGENLFGQLGQADIFSRGDQPGEMGRQLKPISLGKGYVPTAITAGIYHACALLQPGGVIKCWGDNDAGATGLEETRIIGDQAREMGDFLNPVNVGSGLNATALTAGFFHTCALLQPGNLVKCWGLNSNSYAGVLGAGDTRNRGAAKNTMGDNLPPVRL
ncbi:hypothetical protein Vretimale_15034 [Volvox reticuliferus]|nr:hypothetical protein Vretimale_15034 [Volvox reticuliferus]